MIPRLARSKRTMPRVVRFLVEVNGGFAKTRAGVPGFGGDAQFENFRRLQGIFESMSEEELELRTIC
jgi:hypothetical protein